MDFFALKVDGSDVNPGICLIPYENFICKFFTYEISTYGIGTFSHIKFPHMKLTHMELEPFHIWNFHIWNLHIWNWNLFTYEISTYEFPTHETYTYGTANFSYMKCNWHENLWNFTFEIFIWNFKLPHQSLQLLKICIIWNFDIQPKSNWWKCVIYYLLCYPARTSADNRDTDHHKFLLVPCLTYNS